MTVLRGRCWKLGDSISNDQLMASRFVFDYDLSILTKNIMADVVPDFAAEAKSGDFILAGENFAHGSLHIHPFLALKEMGVGIMCRSMPRGAFRLAIYAGVTLLIGCGAVHDVVSDGEEIEVDPARGLVCRLCDGTTIQVEPLSPFLAEIVAAGGGVGYIRKTMAERAA